MMNSNGDLSNKVCIITGGSKGIGFAIAKELFKSGAKVVICSRSGAEVQKAVKKIDKSRRVVIGLKADITKPNDVKALVKTTFKKFGRVDVLVNNAGVFKPFGEFDKVSFKKNLEPLEINLVGTILCCHEVIPLMKKQKFGRIINFSGGGIGGGRPLSHAVSYYTSKGAIVFFTEALAVEIAPFNITVNAVLPGQILTRSTRETFRLTDKKLGPVLAKATRNLKKSGGQPVEPIVELVMFLASEKAAHITGKLLSAKWDNISDLSGKLCSEQYTLRRIEGKMYAKQN